MIKVIVREEEKETHLISRSTTVHWKDSDGKERWIQFISLSGLHEVIPARAAK